MVKFIAVLGLLGSIAKANNTTTNGCKIHVPRQLYEDFASGVRSCPGNWCTTYECEFLVNEETNRCVQELGSDVWWISEWGWLMTFQDYETAEWYTCPFVRMGEGPTAAPPAVTSQAVIDSEFALTYGETCGKFSDNFNRVVNGQNGSLTEHHYQAFVRIMAGEVGMNCGGTIISSRHVLSAAHCTDNDPAAPVLEQSFIFIGIETQAEISNIISNRQNQAYQIESYVNHPEYSIDGYNHDICILKSTREFEFAPNAYPACLPSRDFCLETGTMVSLSGWGRTNPTVIDSQADQFQAVQVPIAACEDTYMSNEFHRNYPFYVCAGTAETGSCKGDSGGPLAYKSEDGIYTVFGVISHRSNGCQGEPGLMTKVSVYLDWIHDNSGVAMMNSNGDLAPTFSCDSEHEDLDWISDYVPIPEVTYAPETDAPETDAPETEAPETEAPETEAPETEAPETEPTETEARCAELACSHVCFVDANGEGHCACPRGMDLVGEDDETCVEDQEDSEASEVSDQFIDPEDGTWRPLIGYPEMCVIKKFSSYSVGQPYQVGTCNVDKRKSKFGYDPVTGFLSHQSDKTEWNNFCVKANDSNNSRLVVAVCDANDDSMVWDYDSLNGHVHLRSDRKRCIVVGPIPVDSWMKISNKCATNAFGRF